MVNKKLIESVYILKGTLTKEEYQKVFKRTVIFLTVLYSS